MIKRPISNRFREPVLAGVKTTTIREEPWPIGKPVMLYSWAGKPYRSRQIDLAPVIVLDWRLIYIAHHEDGTMIYADVETLTVPPLEQTEGFPSREELDAWFRPLIPRGATGMKTLITFRLATAADLVA